MLQTIFRFVANNSFSGDNREDAFDKDQGEVVFENHRRRPSDLLQTIFLTDDCKEQFFSGDGREDAFDKDQGEAVFANQRRRSSDLLQMIMTAGMLLTIWTKRRWSLGEKLWS